MPIEVIIREQGTGGVSNNNSGVPQVDPDNSEEQGVENSNQKQVNALLIDYGKQLLQDGISIYTNYTGNYLLSNQIDTVTTFAADALMVIKGGWVGRIAVAYNTINSMIKSSREVQEANERAQYLKNQMGKVVEMGGRYTND